MAKFEKVRETCYGIIPFRRHQDKWQILLVQLLAGHWSFPKGHPEKDETPKYCANRELSEETGLYVLRYLSENPLTEHYAFERNGRLVAKTVTYYLAEVAGQLAMQPSELKGIDWFSLEAASIKLTFDQARATFLKAQKLLPLV